ncbi:MAG: uroporphyrinogen decarboxylase family protein [Candidatus Latescibacterota bacterium]
MREKERFLDTLQFKPVDRVPFMELGAWNQTIARWVGEGLPESAANFRFMEGNAYFGLEAYESAPIDGVGPHPPFEERTLSEDDRYIKFTDTMGRTRLALKEGTVDGQRTSMDSYVDFPVKNRRDFLNMKKRYEESESVRYPKDWEEIKERLNKSTRPITLLNPLDGTFGCYSMLRNWMGTENLSYLFYDDRPLIMECLDFLTDFFIRVVEKAVTEVPFDFYMIHEDMAGKGGPLVSPQLFREIFTPFYRRLIDSLKSHGVKLILVDTDGDFEALIPAFLEAGVDGFSPIERASNMDPIRLRKQYGNAFSMLGGIDKRVLAKGKKKITEEIERNVLPLIEKGGYIPMVDHAVPPDVSLDHFKYYLELKWKAIDHAW